MRLAYAGAAWAYINCRQMVEAMPQSRKPGKSEAFDVALFHVKHTERGI
jgi:hypothetical protein